MKNILSVFFSVILLAACNMAGGNDKYVVEGTIKNHPSKTVFLEKLTLQKIIVVDSAAVDDKGAFKMQGVSEKGFYRIKLDENVAWFFLLEPAKYNVSIDLKAEENPFKISGSKENDEFQEAVTKINNAQQELQLANYNYRANRDMNLAPQLQAQLQAAAKKVEDVCLQGAKNAKSPYVAMFYITNTPLNEYEKQTLEVIERMEKEIPNASYTKDMRNMHAQYVEQLKAAEAQKQTTEVVGIGKPAPEIDLKTPDGKSIKLSSLKGKVVLIDFWASWCGPCRVEMPNVVAAYNKFKSKGFTVYSVSLDKDMNAWKNAITALNMPWENHVSDLKFWQCEAAVRYGVNGIPATYLLDREGVIVATNLRGPALEQKLAELLP